MDAEPAARAAGSATRRQSSSEERERDASLCRTVSTSVQPSALAFRIPPPILHRIRSARAFGSPPGPRTPSVSRAMATVSNVWQPEFMQGRFFRLVVSHTSAHRQAVGALRAALLPHGVVAFVAHDAIQPTQEWLDVIVRALREAEALAAYLTGDFHDSQWTDQEVGAAVGRELLVLPLKVDQDPYGFYRSLPGNERQHRHGRSRSPNCRDPSNPRANETTDGRGCRRPVRALRWMEQRTGESESGFGQSTVAAEALKLIDSLPGP